MSNFQFFSVLARVLWSSPGLHFTNAGISCCGRTLPSSTRKRSLYGFPALRLSLEMSSHNDMSLPDRASGLTAGLMSIDMPAFEPLMIPLTHLRLILNPTGPSMPPSVKSMSPNSVCAGFPSIMRVTLTFFSWLPHNALPASERGVLLPICPLVPSYHGLPSYSFCSDDSLL